jgi:hypothetical protein
VLHVHELLETKCPMAPWGNHQGDVLSDNRTTLLPVCIGFLLSNVVMNVLAVARKAATSLEHVCYALDLHL